MLHDPHDGEIMSTSWPAQLAPRTVAPSRTFHATRDVAMAGGMVLLSESQLQRAPLAGLQRIAAWLAVSPRGPWGSDAAQRHDLVKAILRAQAVIAKGPRSKRWDVAVDAK